MGLKAELHKLTSKCKSVSDLQVDYYSTGLPDKLPITIEKLTDLIETFPSRMDKINDGKGIPMMVRVLCLSVSVLVYTSVLKSPRQCNQGP